MGEGVIHLADETAMLMFGARIAGVLVAGDIIALRGDLGAGKTTLTRGILRGLGLAGEAPSPTFAIVQPYAPPEVRLPVAHVDLYRLDTPEDADELGLDEYLADGALVIEWPERIGARLWDDALVINIMPDARGGRGLTVSLPPGWRERWPAH